jgi:hypothetical protein
MKNCESGQGDQTLSMGVYAIISEKNIFYWFYDPVGLLNTTYPTVR